MKRTDLLQLEAQLMEEVVKRRRLGGYSADAAGILFLSEALYKISQHLLEIHPTSRKKHASTDED